MARPLRSSIATLAACLICATLLLLVGRSSVEPAAGDILQSEGDLAWYRGNIHTHSLWSDGDDYLEMIGLWYKEHGYDFLCFTDHNVLSNTERWIDVEKSKGGRKAYDKLTARFPKEWVEQRTVDGRLQVRLKTFAEVSDKLAEPDKFLLIQGEEITDRYQKWPVHLNATNIQELIPPTHGDSVFDVMQNNVNAVIAQRERTGQPILVHLNHPNFYYAVTAEDLMRVRGENFFEVYNGHPAVHNSGDERHASSDRIWDIMLTRRIAELGMPLMYGLAVDDGHNYHGIPNRGSNPGRGWIVVLAEALSPEALIDAMEHGRFYASSGVALQQVAASPKGLSVQVEPDDGVTYTIDFLGTRSGYDTTSAPVLDADGQPIRTTRRYSNDVGAVLKTVTGRSGSYEFTGDELYVRARITSSRKHPNPSEPGEFERAWTQPTKGPAAPMRTED